MPGCAGRACTARADGTRVSFTPERLLRALEDGLAEAGDPLPTGLCVALSGGLDSTVLAAALASLRDAGRLRWPLRALHVDHALHPDSAHWSAACIAWATSRQLPIEVVRVDARPATGRKPGGRRTCRALRRPACARYAALLRGDARPAPGESEHAPRLAAGEVLLTAHQADDQWETILLQSLRGGGLHAVAGMSALTRWGNGWLGRPLLAWTRDELHAWAVARELHWLEDPSNLDARFDRNYLRLHVLPRLRERWPAAARTAGRIAGFAAEALVLEREIAAADLAAAGEGATLAVAALFALPPARQRLMVRAWLDALRLPLPPSRTLEALLRDVRAAAPDRVPRVRWPGVVVHRYRGRLYAGRAAGHAPKGGEWRVADSACWALDDTARLELVAATGEGLSRDRTPEQLRVVLRPPGAVFRPQGAAHRRPLRKWFQERGVLPWARETIPVLCDAREIVAIGDLACAESLAARPGEPSWRIAWHGRPLLTEQEALAFNWRDHPPIP